MPIVFPDEVYIILSIYKSILKGFSDSSVGKESACNTGDPGSIPGSERSAGEGIGYPLHYSSASLVAQLVKNLPVMLEIWVQSLGWEDPLEKGQLSLKKYFESFFWSCIKFVWEFGKCGIFT